MCIAIILSTFIGVTVEPRLSDSVPLIIRNGVQKFLKQVLYNAKLWRGKTLADLAKQLSFANILPNQIPDSL